MTTENEPVILPTPTYHVNQALHHLEQAGVDIKELREAALFFSVSVKDVDKDKLWPIADIAEDIQDMEALADKGPEQMGLL